MWLQVENNCSIFLAGLIVNFNNWKHCQPWVFESLSVCGVDGVAVYELGDGDHAEVGLVAPGNGAIV